MMTKLTFTVVALAAITSLARRAHADDTSAPPVFGPQLPPPPAVDDEPAPAPVEAPPPAPEAPAVARREAAHVDSPWQLHLNGGPELTGGGGAFAASFRGRAAAGYAFGGGRVRPELAVGAIFGAGSIYVTDPRALDGSLDIHVRTLGAEAQLGLRFVDGGAVDSRIFASAAILHASMDSRLMYDRVPGVSDASNRGVRLSIGGNWADKIGSAIANDTCSGKSCGGSLTYVMLPQQAELVYERDAGSNRVGVMFGWGI